MLRADLAARPSGFSVRRQRLLASALIIITTMMVLLLVTSQSSDPPVLPQTGWYHSSTITIKVYVFIKTARRSNCL